MRIVGGKYKSRVLLEFKGSDIRPTPDKVRESFFNIVQGRIYGSRFLDLFCGTGAMGIEALSRGAKHATFNDLSADSIALLKKNLERLKVLEDYRIIKGNALSLLENSNEKFDIIYIDPPYKSDLGLKSLALAGKVISDNGIIVYENENPFESEIAGLNKVDERKYGRVYLTFFEKEQQ